MRRNTPYPAQTRDPSGRARSLGAWVRCLLVLVLVFDFVSAPFHQHRHDGVAGQLEWATPHTAHGAAQDGRDSHADSDKPAQASHATSAIRIDPSRWAQLPPVDDTAAQPALVSVAQLFAARSAQPPPFWPPDRDRADFSSHRSLPPAGRAPPRDA